MAFKKKEDSLTAEDKLNEALVPKDEQPYSIPKNWVWTRITSLADQLRGVSYNKRDVSSQPTEGSILVLRAGNIQNGEFQIAEDCVYVPNTYISEAQILQLGDVIVVGSSGSKSVVGKAAQANSQMANTSFGAFLTLFRPSKSINASYYGWFFQSRYYRDAISESSIGININNLRREHFEALALPLPPLPEQQSIADKLDSLLGKIKEAKTLLDEIPEILRNLRQSILAAACSGRLTEGWRKESTIPAPVEKTLKEVLKVSSGNFLPARNMAEGGTIPVFGGNGINGYHDEANVYEETLVLGRVGFYCGSIHLTPELAWVTDNALLVKHDENETLKRFLYFALQVIDLRVNDSFTAQPVISGSKIYPLKILIPDIREQTEIVHRIESLFAKADDFEAQYKEAIELVESLPEIILSKAFRGELVPQNPDDEPAVSLLERILSDKSSITSVETISIAEVLKLKIKTEKQDGLAHSTKRSLLQVLNEAQGKITPEELFRKAGYDFDDLNEVEAFYAELSKEVRAKRIKENRSKSSDVITLERTS